MNLILSLTPAEAGALAEAIRLAQEISYEGTGKLVPALSRIQRKINSPAGAS